MVKKIRKPIDSETVHDKGKYEKFISDLEDEFGMEVKEIKLKSKVAYIIFK